MMNEGSHFVLTGALRAKPWAMEDRPALHTPGRASLSYRLLWTGIDRVAEALTRIGITRGDSVALVMTDGPELLVSLLAATQVAAAAPIPSAYKQAELEAALLAVRARALVCGANQELALAAAHRLGLATIIIDADERALTLHPRIGPAALAPSPPAFSPDTALLIQTSATTGFPKLVPIRHAQLAAMVDIVRGTLTQAEAGTYLVLLSLCHLQCLVPIFVQLFTGGSVVCTPGFRPDAFLGWLDAYQPTDYTAPPTLHRAILSLCRGERLSAFRALRFVTSLGAPLPESLLSELEGTLGVPVIEGYGMTEAGLITMTSGDPTQRKRGSVGRSAGPEIAITCAEGRTLGPGEHGEICLRGDTVLRAYAHNPEANRQAFREGWLRTGDIGHLDDDGHLFIHGRVKECINRGGEKILPYEIEETLAHHPAVREVAVFGYPHARLGEEIGAAIVRKPDSAVGVAELRRFVLERLADFKAPRTIVFVDEIPKGRTGKYQRARLAGVLGIGEGQPAAPGATKREPMDALETQLVALWSELLGGKPVAPTDDFFQLGGDSLLAAIMLSRVKKELGRRIDLSTLLLTSTIESLAETLRAPIAPSRPLTGLLQLRSEGAHTPMVFISRVEGALVYRVVLRHLAQDRPVYGLMVPGHDGAQPPPPTIEAIADQLAASLRALPHRGPYWLAGLSLDGVLAVEVARRRLARGEGVAGIALIDSDCFGQGYVGYRMAWLRHHLTELAKRSPRRWATYPVDHWRNRKRIAVERTPFETSINTALRQFRAPPFPVEMRPRTLLLRCAEAPREERARKARQWSSVVGKNLLLRDVPGSHLTVMKEPNGRAVAERLDEFFRIGERS